MSRPARREGKGESLERGRFSSRRKTQVVLRVLRGEDLDTLSRELGVTAATIAAWRDQFVAGGLGALKSRLADARDEEIRRLQAKIGEITMANELLRAQCHSLEAGRPLALRRQRA